MSDTWEDRLREQVGGTWPVQRKVARPPLSPAARLTPDSLREIELLTGWFIDPDYYGPGRPGYSCADDGGKWHRIEFGDWIVRTEIGYIPAAREPGTT